MWNWKTALCSGLYRAPAFLLVSFSSGAAHAARATLAEFFLFAAISGFAGAATQRLSRLRPWWRALFYLLAVLPLFTHTAEWGVHHLLQTPGRRRGLLISIAMTVVAESFNLFVMSRGLFHAGPGGLPLLEDLRRLPALFLRPRPD